MNSKGVDRQGGTGVSSDKTLSKNTPNITYYDVACDRHIMSVN